MPDEPLKSRSIFLLSTAEYLVPRLQLEKAALEEAGYEVHVFHYRDIALNERFLKGLFRYYTAAIRKACDCACPLVHITHIVQLPLALIFNKRGYRVIYDAYERYSIDIPEKHFPPKYRNFVRKMIELFEDVLIFTSIDAVLAVSTPNEVLRDRYSRSCSNVECLYNVPPKRLVYSGNLEDKFKNTRLSIAYVGAIIAEKGSDMFIPLLLKLRESVPGYRAHLIGSFIDAHNRNKFISELSECGLIENVRLHGQLGYEAMHRVLEQCHIGLTLYSRSKRLSLVGKGSSRKNFTYMCAGMGILSSRVGELSRVIEEEECGIVIENPYDVDNMCGIIKGLNYDREKLLSYARNGILAILNKYNWDLEKEKLVRLYHRTFFS